VNPDDQSIDRLRRAAANLAALRQLIAGVCHEINNPLTAVQGLSDILAQDASDSQTAEDLRIIARETERAITVVRNLRVFARESGPPQPCNMNDALANVLDARGYEMRARGMTLSTATADDVPGVRASYEELLLLLLLLVLSAEQTALATTDEDGPADDVHLQEGGPDTTTEAPFLHVETVAEEGAVQAVLAYSDRLHRAGLDSSAMEAARRLAQDLGGGITLSTDREARASLTLTLPANPEC
jgi:hypothetical protein